jgi:hypothetical protein
MQSHGRERAILLDPNPLGRIDPGGRRAEIVIQFLSSRSAAVAFSARWRGQAD